MRYCLRPGCSTIVSRGYCATHAPKREELRPNQDVRDWYHSPRWRQLRGLKLAREPMCPGYGRPTCGRPTAHVDHKIPHKGDPARFWDWFNLQALCASCHAKKTGAGL